MCNRRRPLYRLLGDEARLRLLRVLSRERLNVTELTGVLGLAQSGVSRHLGLLKDAGLVVEERDGGFSYYRAAAARGRRRAADRGAAGAVRGVGRRSAVRADEARLQEVLRLRKENFDAHAGPDTRDARQLVPGPQLGGLVARARPADAAAQGRRPRLRRRLPDDRSGALGVARRRRRSLGGRARRAPRRWRGAAACRT